MIPRLLTKIIQKSKKSVLLLGPRQTGKSTLFNELNPDLAINLARESTYLEFASRPSELEERLFALTGGTILIDEIQRLPSLLNTAQAILDENPDRFRFYLTGSSARKLKRGRANLLPGRVHVLHLGPLVYREIPESLSIHSLLAFGSLPGIITEESDDEKSLTLKSYAATYLKEEIQAEALTKNIEGFSRFIYVAAAEATRYLDLSKLASQASVPRQSAVRYFEILEDTLIVQRCEAFAESSRKRLVQHPKFFFFDIGVLNGLLGNFEVSLDRIGYLFEHFIFNQITATAYACNESIRISSYRTASGVEVDFILEYKNSVTAIEVKASKNISSFDLKGLKNFKEFYGEGARLVMLYMGEHKKIIDGIEILPWKKYIEIMEMIAK